MRPLKTTRDKIVSVARIVFANLSVYKTTMEDIARASKIGRRTIYSYFGSKEELYAEVVNTEIDSIIKKLTEVTQKPTNPSVKFKEFVEARMKAVQDLAMRNDSLKKDFINNIARVNEIRKRLDQKEISLIEGILKQGMTSKKFKIDDIENLAFAIQASLKSLEVPFIKDSFGSWSKQTTETYTKTLLNGINK